MPCSNLRFLAIEDHHLQREMLVELLARLGATQVHATADGPTALRLMADPEIRIDVTLLDLSMPAMDGLEVLRHAAGIAPGLSVILVSASDPAVLSSAQRVAEAYGIDVLGTITKPVSAAKLAAVLCAFRGRQAPPHKSPEFSMFEITEAWANDEFDVLFEPQIHLATGAVQGFQAVPCWKHPTRGLLERSSFMASIEARGLHDDFTWHMLEKAFAGYASWDMRHPGVRLAFTLDFNAFDDLRLSRLITALATKADISSQGVTLFIPEKCMHAMSAAMMENLLRLRLVGFGLGVDDFGAGAMSLEPFSVLPLTSLKVHRDILVSCSRDKSSEAALAVALDAAQNLGLTAIGDGLCTKDEWNLLYRWGCHVAQGPFVVKPMRLQEINRWMRTWTEAKSVRL